MSAAKGSVVEYTGTAIVNAANEGCLGGGGVDGAITAAGGEALHAAREALPVLDGGIRCPTGQSKLTTAGELECVDHERTTYLEPVASQVRGCHGDARHRVWRTIAEKSGARPPPSAA